MVWEPIPDKHTHTHRQTHRQTEFHNIRLELKVTDHTYRLSGVDIILKNTEDHYEHHGKNRAEVGWHISKIYI